MNPGHRQQVVETGSAEPLPQPVGQPVLVAENHAGHHRGALSFEAAHDRPAQPSPLSESPTPSKPPPMGTDSTASAISSRASRPSSTAPGGRPGTGRW